MKTELGEALMPKMGGIEEHNIRSLQVPDAKT
jgi:hypothetical protein